MTCSCPCIRTELQALQAYSSLKAGLCKKSENPANPGFIYEWDIRSILRLVAGDNFDVGWSTLLR